MRNLIVAACTVALAGPALAQSTDAPGRHRAQEMRALAAAQEVDRIAHRIGRTADAVMDIDIGPVMSAIDPDAPRGRITVGDLASRDDPDARAHMDRQIRGATAGFEAAVGQAAILAPQLSRAIAESVQRIREAVREGGPPGRGGDVNR